MTRRTLVAVADRWPRCLVCRHPIDPAATVRGQWTTNPDGTRTWRPTGRYDTHPACDPI